MKPLVVAYKPLSDDVTAQLREHIELVQVDGAEASTGTLTKAEDAIGASLKITPQMPDHAPRLKAWSTISVGYDNFDAPDLTRRGIVLAHIPDVLAESTVDTVFSLTLSPARRVAELAEQVRVGSWQRSVGPELYGTDVQDKTIGIVGLGRIGAALAHRAAHGFRTHVFYTNRHLHPEAETQYGARRMILDTLLAEADFVCLQVPLTPGTQYLIGVAELAKTKRSAILINASCGAVVDEVAFTDALRSEMIRGVGLDVLEHEPLPTNSPLLATNNVVTLPYIGSATHKTRHAMARCVADDLIEALVGTLRENLVNPQVLEPARTS